MARAIEIVEVGPRDGLQSEPEVLSTATKLELINRLVASGLKRLEVASFVNPKRVPQMADAEAVLAGLAKVPGVQYVGLVLNRKGFDRALAAGCTEVGLVTAATNSFSERNQGATTEELIRTIEEIAPLAREAGVRMQVTLSTAFGCPFEGEVPAARVVEICRRLAKSNPLEIALADTIGVAVPSQVTALVEQVRGVVGDVAIRCHFHNTRNTAVANAYAAVLAGVSTLDASVGGVGGCPFAPNATGNVGTEDLVYMLSRAGYDTGIDLTQLIETARWLGEQRGKPVPSMVSKAGGFPAGTVRASA
ncbi:hydroxymethylglutaryl-CoA lyase [Steroidobacter agaridevorans]|uniref:Hydroxymethylglutaryl-CoA lyase n=1 Tax=Steroidobacter agaridevorans TaxID=2695856 RepID=A0A829YLV5_9GAMM|nr:hydroxymethylglutaryl-CoA lyase [Steroidobacter agaridevorans]GFE83486.1 hydroxymethylglutaryl-CoA lyase [Steroidobacter agaridevorans]